MPTLSIVPLSTWTNDTLASTLCAQLTEGGSSAVYIEAASQVSPAPFFLLPECFYTLSANVTTLSLHNVIIQGDVSSSSTLGPLARLPSGLIVLDLQTVALVDPSTAYSASYFPYTPNWSQLFSSYPSLQSLTLLKAGINGSLPSVLPVELALFDVSHNALSGTISVSLLASSAVNLTETTLRLSNNQLSGTVPGNLLSKLSTSVGNLNVDFSSNSLTGSIPADLFNVSSLTNLETVDVNFANNQLEGTIPADFLSSSLSRAASITIDMSANRLNGTVTASLFSELEDLESLALNVSSNRISGSVPNFWPTMNSTGLSLASFDFSNNSLTGSIPTTLASIDAPAALQFVQWDLSSNLLSGAIPSGLLGPAPASLLTWKLFLENNQLSGALPSTLFSTADLTQTYTIMLSLASNDLTGQLPADFLSGIPSTLNILSLDLSGNAFGGSVPSAFLEPFTSSSRISLQLSLAECELTGSLPDNLLGAVTTGMSLYFDSNKLSGSYDYESLIYNASINGFKFFDLSASNNELTGPLDIPSVSRGYPLNLNLSDNQLTSLSIDDAATYLSYLDVSNNADMSGKVPQIVFSAGSQVLLFNASNTAAFRSKRWI